MLVRSGHSRTLLECGSFVQFSLSGWFLVRPHSLKVAALSGGRNEIQGSPLCELFFVCGKC